MLNNYRQLLGKLDIFSQEIRKKYPDSFACEPGCVSCCVAGIRVWRVEYDNIKDAIASHLKKGEAIPTTQGDRPATDPSAGRHVAFQAPRDDTKCSLLDDKGRCTIYDARPVVCRLWGLPQLQANRSLQCCEKNFQKGLCLDDLPVNDAINLKTVLTTLAAINHVYCRESGFDPEERFELNSLVD